MAEIVQALSYRSVTNKVVYDVDVRTAFKKLLEQNKQGELVGAEIGVYEGVNALIMLGICNNLKLYLIDDWNNETLTIGEGVKSEIFTNTVRLNAEQNLSWLNGRKIFMHKKSQEAYKDFTDEFFDFIYIDGDHTYDGALRDMDLWYSKLKKGGIFGGHDVGMPDVYKAFTDFVVKNKISSDKIGCELDTSGGRSDWWILKE